MSVLSVQEDFQARQSGTKLSEKKATTTHTRRWIVRTTTVNDDGAIVLGTARGLPGPYDKHPNDSSSFATGIDAKPRAGQPTTWDVVVTYSSDLPSQDPNNPNGKPGKNPKDRPPKYSLGYTTLSKVLEYDFRSEDPDGNPTGYPPINSAGERFDPPLEFDQYLPVIGVEIATDFFAISLADWCGAINGNPFKINGHSYKPFTVLAKIRQSPFFENGLSYWTTNYEFTVNKGTWLYRPLDQGTRKRVAKPGGQLYDGNAKFVTITDAYGQPYNHPVNLDGSGQQLAPGASPVFLDGTHDKHMDFGPFYPFPVRNFGDF
jgi:hypothetical protein